MLPNKFVMLKFVMHFCQSVALYLFGKCLSTPNIQTSTYNALKEVGEI